MKAQVLLMTIKEDRAANNAMKEAITILRTTTIVVEEVAEERHLAKEKTRILAENDQVAETTLLADNIMMMMGGRNNVVATGEDTGVAEVGHPEVVLDSVETLVTTTREGTAAITKTIVSLDTRLIETIMMPIEYI